MKIITDWKNENISGIYQIRNKINGHRYIGSAFDIKGRIRRHLSSLRRNVHYNTYLQNAWNKYHEENFSFEILEICSKEHTYLIEQKYIDALCPKYNLSKKATGGNGFANIGRKLSDAHKLIISIAMSARRLSDEHKARIGAKHKGKKYSDETRKKMSDARKGTKMKPRSKEYREKLSNSLKGRKFSEQHKANLSAARKGKPLSEKQKEVLLRMTETNRNKQIKKGVEDD